MSLISLKHRVFKGAFWTIGGNASSQILRLGGNLLLTRLLFPEAFGLMALVNVFILGIAMFSDIGINASIIQNKRSDNDFLNTAWTLQVIRGVVIWILICIIAWPAALFYDESILLPLLVVAGFSSVIMGFQSTKIIIANRKLELKKITIIELTSSFIGMVFMIVGAWVTQSVWALVVGGLIQSAVKVFMSFSYFSGSNNIFLWDKSAAISIYKFGRWLMLSSFLTFLASQGDRLIIGRILDVEFLGIYNIAIMLIAAVYMVSQKLGMAVFFPSYSELVRERPERLQEALQKSRLAQIILLWPIAVVFVFWGNEIVQFLYDDRYLDAGWMLEILALGMLLGILRISYVGLLPAMGKTGVATALLGVQIVVKLSALIIGNYYWGPIGMIYALALESVILYPIDTIVYSRLSLWHPELDIPIVIMSIIVIILFFQGL